MAKLLYKCRDVYLFSYTVTIELNETKPEELSILLHNI